MTNSSNCILPNALDIPSIPAALSAIHDAVGFRLFHLPATPQRVFGAMKEKRHD